MITIPKWASLGAACLLSWCSFACRPSDVLSVPSPAGTIGNGVLQSQSGAEMAFNGAKGTLFQTFAGASFSLEFGEDGGFVQWGGVLTDEFTWSFFLYDASDANIDARMTAAGSGFGESGDNSVQGLLAARSGLLLAEAGLAKFEPASGRPKIAEALALAGYSEVMLAEGFCSGVPLSSAATGGGVVYGMPLTTDSLLGVAEAHFDSALAYANGDPTTSSLAGVGLARARLDRGHYADAAAAASGVPTDFVYDAELEPTLFSGASTFPNLYATQFASAYPFFPGGCGFIDVPEREGGNGLNFLSAADPRLVIDSTLGSTCDGGTWHYPVKFGVDVQTDVPLATGVEARLIEAENQLSGGAGPWLAALNTLRTDGTFTVDTVNGVIDTVYNPGTGGVAGLAPLADPGTQDAEVDLHFREREFWMFGTGTRLGDLRRLVRQYSRDAETVFPHGPYGNAANPGLPSPLPNYGTDVNLTLPTVAGTAATGISTPNPYYKGCLTSTKVA